MDHVESPEYHTPPVATPSSTILLSENSILLPVHINLGATPSVDNNEENRPICCHVSPPTVAALVPITLEDEIVSFIDIDCAIVCA